MNIKIIMHSKKEEKLLHIDDTFFFKESFPSHILAFSLKKTP